MQSRRFRCRPLWRFGLPAGAVALVPAGRTEPVWAWFSVGILLLGAWSWWCVAAVDSHAVRCRRLLTEQAVPLGGVHRIRVAWAMHRRVPTLLLRVRGRDHGLTFSATWWGDFRRLCVTVAAAAGDRPVIDPATRRRLDRWSHR